MCVKVSQPQEVMQAYQCLNYLWRSAGTDI